MRPRKGQPLRLLRQLGCRHGVASRLGHNSLSRLNPVAPGHKACKRELRRSALMPADIAIRQFKATAPVKHQQQEECQMAYLELSPAIAALRARPEEFSDDTLHHLGSRHRFRFLSEDSVEIHADCGCSVLKASQEQTKVFHAAYRDWHASYWRPLEINREFASHFEPALWRRAAIWLLRRLLTVPRAAKASSVRTDLPLWMGH